METKLIVAGIAGVLALGVGSYFVAKPALATRQRRRDVAETVEEIQEQGVARVLPYRTATIAPGFFGP